MESIRVLIVDDLQQVREGLASVLRLASGRDGTRIEVIGEAKSGSEAVQQARSLRPDVILMDLEMPVLDGYEATRQIKAQQPGTRIIILSIHDGSEQRERARIAGADGFVVKGTGYQILLNAILGRDEPHNLFEKGEGT